MADRTLELTLLYDFFGELLTEKQREAYDLYHNDDLSLSEIAELYGTTRQAVFALLKKGERTMRNYEAKTGVIARFTAMQRELDALSEQADRLASLLPEGEEKSLSLSIARGIDRLKG